MNPYYKYVENEEEKMTFDSFWKTAWNEKQFFGEENNMADKIFLLDNEIKIGSLELSSYYGLDSLETVYPFLSEGVVRNNLGKVALVDKVSILKQHRGKINNILKLAYAINEYTMINEYKYAIAILCPDFYNALIKIAKVPIGLFAGGQEFDGDYAILLDCEACDFAFKQHPRYKRMFANLERNLVK